MVAVFVFAHDQSSARVRRDVPLTLYGNASWYGAHWQGRKMADGHRFDARSMTAASKTLPFGTVLRVTNLSNNSSVLVTVEDRGPYVGSRIIDLSEGAARKIGLIEKGVARVKIEVFTNDHSGS